MRYVPAISSTAQCFLGIADKWSQSFNETYMYNMLTHLWFQSIELEYWLPDREENHGMAALALILHWRIKRIIKERVRNRDGKNMDIIQPQNFVDIISSFFALMEDPIRLWTISIEKASNFYEKRERQIKPIAIIRTMQVMSRFSRICSILLLEPQIKG